MVLLNDMIRICFTANYMRLAQLKTSFYQSHEASHQMALISISSTLIHTPAN